MSSLTDTPDKGSPAAHLANGTLLTPGGTETTQPVVSHVLKDALQVYL